MRFGCGRMFVVDWTWLRGMQSGLHMQVSHSSHVLEWKRMISKMDGTKGILMTLKNKKISELRQHAVQTPSFHRCGYVVAHD